ncbi:MAG: deoxyribose-phosphate aldolase [Rhodospirillales bacterium]
MEHRLTATAKRALAAMDLTSLGDNDREDGVRVLCRRATGPHGRVAAICVWPRFIAACQEELAGTGVPVAVVANFPDGGADLGHVISEIEAAIADGADEIDVVWPWQAWLDGNRQAALDLLAASRSASANAVLKVILETGRLKDAGIIDAASRAAIDAGADFIKTSTGKVDVNATPEAAEIMLRAIADTGANCGFKAAGGIRTVANAAIYFQLADRIMGAEWATPAKFRIGASGLLDDCLATLDGKAPGAPVKGY